MKIAIVGTGISGLMAAHRLHPEHEIVVYEAADHLGGHSNTVRVDGPDEIHWIDTGFIVFNDRNYPNFEALLAELGVPSQRSHMGFSVADGKGRFEYSGTPWGLFARPAHLLSPSFLGMLCEWRRFNREARELIGMNGTAPSLGHWLEERGFSRHFVERLIVPQASAVWSADPKQMWSFPASFMAEFFDNHGMYSLRDRPKWRTVSGGSRSYVEAISAPWRERVRLRSPVRRIERLPGGVRIEADGCESEEFDEVVIAAHSDQALALLADPSEAEREILGAIPYQRNEAVLHTDTAMMPRRRAAWSSWNFHLAEGPSQGSTVTYWMNNLQRLRAGREYLLTLNRSEEIDPEKVLRRFSYDHPMYTADGVAAHARHGEISGMRRTHYCGAYWGWGFHEDGVVSALRACERIAPGSTLGARLTPDVSELEGPIGSVKSDTSPEVLAA
ncbi:MAG TPA: FAD-dependent oxidoreductase [Solirubrobacterales bacterium]|nr:FAD-dependent oxidoreductase [Solirubrobacterales bacterium]